MMTSSVVICSDQPFVQCLRKIEFSSASWYSEADKFAAANKKELYNDKAGTSLEVIRRLKAEYPLADCTLDYEHAWQLLVEVRLAAQCTDARVNIVVRDLFAKYPSLDALAQASPEEIEAIVRPLRAGSFQSAGHQCLYADASG